jgi:transcriptional regulator with XRE-family HTH domain
LEEKAEFQITLKAARVNAGYTLDDVAKELHVAKQTVCNWENGAVELTVARARQLSALYNMPLRFIIIPTKSNII